MRTITLLIVGMLFSAKLFAGFFIQNVQVLPAQPVAGDSVFITYSIYYPSTPDWNYYYNIEQFGNAYTLTICDRMGQQTGINWKYNTISLGMLPGGNYSLKILYHWTSQFNDSTCHNFIAPMDSEMVTFQVQLPNAITDYSIGFCRLLQADKLYINSMGSGSMQLQVSDLSGSLIYSMATNLTDGPNLVNLDLPQLPAGIYFYQLQMGDKVKVLKWVQP